MMSGLVEDEARTEHQESKSWHWCYILW